MLDRSVAPEFGAIIYPNLQKPETIHLANGLHVHILNAGSQPVIKLELIVRSGICVDTVPGVSWLTSKLLTEGTKSKSSTDIAQLFEFYGSFVEINPGFDNTSISIYLPRRFFREVIDLFLELILEPAFQTEEIEILKSNKIQQLKVNEEKNSFVASRKIRESLFGVEVAYGRSLSIADVEKLNREDVLSFYETSFFLEPELFISGHITDEEIDILKSSPFNELPHQPFLSEFGDMITSNRNIFVEKPDSVQSSIRQAWHIPPKSSEDHNNLIILNEILGGYFGSRLMKNLREDKGYTYGVHSYPVFLQKGSFLVISADVIAEHTKEALDEIEKEIKMLKEHLASNAELETVCNYMSGSFLNSVSTPFQIMDKFKAVYFHDLDYSYYTNFFKSLQEVAPEHLIETARIHLQLDRMHTAIVGKK